METKEKIIKILNEALSVADLNVIDESHLHATHKEAKASGGGHFRIEIVSDDFSGKSSIERHRMINKLLFNQLKNEIHALSITAKSLKEISN